MERAIAFDRDNAALAADHREEHPLGLWIRSSAHPRMWTLNQLHVTEPQPELTATALVAELDRGLADAGHRRAVVAHDATGRRIAEDMRAAGFDVAPVMVMLLDGTLPEPDRGVAREIGEPEMRALEARVIAGSGDIPESDHEVVLAGHAHMRSVLPGTRRFAGRADGLDVGQTMLYTRGGVGNPEEVMTLPGHRGRGVAAATVTLAAHEALAAGCDLVFIVCDAATGPFPLYAGLGFRAAGRIWSFTRSA